MGESRKKSKASLKSQLADYSQGACEQLERPENASSIKNWASYSAAAASALAAVAAADAGVIYSGIQNITVGPNLGGFTNRTSQSVNIDGVGGAELRFGAFEQSNAGAARGYGIGNGTEFAAVATTSFYNQVKFSGSQNVGPSQVFLPFGYLAINFTAGVGYAPAGNFNNGTSGIAGFRFNPGDGNHYGWIRLHLEDTDGNTLTDKLTVVDWAYESTVDAAIRAGDQGFAAVPEPGSLTLLGLALGCGALPALRRRRQLQKEAASQAKA